jgi:hypothetical protein
MVPIRGTILTQKQFHSSHLELLLLPKTGEMGDVFKCMVYSYFLLFYKHIYHKLYK